MKKLLAVLLALVMLVSLAACAGNTDKDNPSSDAPANSDNPSMKANVNKKIAMIMQQGGLGDQGFNDTAYAGLMTCKEKYDLDVNAVECTDTTQGETLIRELCEAGYGLIINLEAGISGNMYTVARDYPDIYFVVVGRQLRINAVDGFTETPKNVIESYITLNEHSFLAGVVAAFAATDGNTLVEGVGQHEGCNIGILFGAESVGFYQYGDGFRQGALFYNPDAKVYIDYTVGFSDTANAQSIAQNILHTKRLQIECRGNISTGADSAQIFLKLPVRHRIPLATLLNVHHCVIRKAISADSDITSILHLRTDLISRRQPGIFIATLAVFNSSQTGV